MRNRSRRSRSDTGAGRHSLKTKTRRSAAGDRDSGSRSARHPPARKRFGQHFLEPAWVGRLLDAVAPAPDEIFLEIGPGRGALTFPLAQRAGQVIAIELDRDLASRLAREVPANVRIVQADFLAVELPALLEGHVTPVRVIGSLPYNVASPILFRLLHGADEGRRFREATVMLQREVADRLMATAGDREYGALSIQVQLLADVDRLLNLPPGAFRPPPKVDSAVVRLRFRPPRVDVGAVDVFERIVRGVFLQRRKMLANALKPVADSFGRSARDVLEHAQLDGGRRPETLTLDDVARLARAVL